MRPGVGECEPYHLKGKGKFWVSLVNLRKGLCDPTKKDPWGSPARPGNNRRARKNPGAGGVGTASPRPPGGPGPPARGPPFS